jgi:hypothetical protein
MSVKTIVLVKKRVEANSTGKADSVLLNIRSLADNLDQHPLSTSPIKLTVKDLLPRAKIQAAIGDCHHNLTSHDLTFHVRIGVVFPGAIVTVLADRLVRGQLLQPVVVILVQAAFNIVDQKNIKTVACRSCSPPICPVPE